MGPLTFVDKRRLVKVHWVTKEGLVPRLLLVSCDVFLDAFESHPGNGTHSVGVVEVEVTGLGGQRQVKRVNWVMTPGGT